MNRRIIVAALMSAVLTGGADLRLDGEGVAEGAEREITEHERKMMQVPENDLKAAIAETREVRRKHLKWNRKRRANKRTVIVLDPPLAKLGRDDVVDVESFHTSIDNAGGQETGWWTWGRSTGGWIGELRSARIPVHYYSQNVGQGPYLDPRWEESRKWYQRLKMGWGQFEVGRGIGVAENTLTIRGRLWERRFRRYPIASQEDAKKFMEWHGLSFKDWKASLAEPEIQARMRRADERWAEIALRGTEQYAQAFEGIHDPVLLINGKFLITRNTMRRQGGNPVARAYQTANWMIQQGLKEITRAQRAKREGLMKEVAEIALDEIGYGEEERARIGQVLQLERPEERGADGAVLIEWVYDRKTRLGKKLRTVMRRWAETLPPGTKWVEHEASDPKTQARAEQVMPGQKVEEMMARDFFWKDPVVLVNGRYLVVRSRFDTIRQTLHTINAVARLRVDGRELAGDR